MRKGDRWGALLAESTSTSTSTYLQLNHSSPVIIICVDFGVSGFVLGANWDTGSGTTAGKTIRQPISWKPKGGRAAWMSWGCS